MTDEVNCTAMPLVTDSPDWYCNNLSGMHAISGWQLVKQA